MTDLQRQTAALLRALGAGLGVALEPDDQAACGLRIDDRVDLALGCDEARAAVVANACIGELPEAGAEAVLRQLLAANHGAAVDTDAVWSLARETLVATRRFPLAGLDAQALADGLSELVAHAFELQDALRAGPVPAAMPAAMFGMVAA
jgi:hypothetical protein